jgi:Ca-activated chloride channel family protein
MTAGSFVSSNAFRALVLTLFVVAVIIVLLRSACDIGGGGGDELEITMWSSGEKMTYLRDVVEDYNDEDHTSSSGKDIKVEVVQVNSGPMSDHLIARIRDGIEFPDNAPEPHIISPSVDSWLTRVNYVTSTQTFDLANTKPLALTPVVIAMYEEMARCLGWPNTELGWADIIALAQSPEGWAAYPCARAEWGRKPLLAWTDPSVSSTARSALFATYAAAAGKSADELTAADVQDPAVQQYVQSLQSAVDHYFPETLKLQAKLFDGPKFVQFVPLEEYNLVWLRDGLISDGSTTRPLERRMVAIYPKEGTFWHNNPGAILHGVEWTDAEHQEAAADFVDYLLDPERQQIAMEKGFRPANPEVAAGEKLSASYGIDPQQPARLLGAVEPSVAEAIIGTWQDVKKPGVVVLVVDTSGSMTGDKIEKARQGAEAFLDAVAPNNHVGMVTFSSTLNERIEVAPLSSSKFDLAETIQGLDASGETAMYDAIAAAVGMADAYEVSGEAIRAVLVLSDGQSNAGATRLCDVVLVQDREERNVGCNYSAGNADLLGVDPAIQTEHHVAIFAIGYGEDADTETLRIITEATNGVSTTADPDSIRAVLETFGRYF